MKSGLIIILIVLSQLISAQTYHAEYTGLTKLKPNINTPLDSNAAQSINIASLLMPQYVEMKYTMQLYSNQDYSFLVLEITEGSLLGINMAGEKVKIFIDHKSSVVYDCGLKTQRPFVATPVTSKSRKKGAQTAVIVEGADTATITFDKKVPKWVMGKIALSGNEYGVSQFKSGADQFYLKSWNLVKFNFTPELEEAKKTCTRQSDRPMNLLFPNK